MVKCETFNLCYVGSNPTGLKLKKNIYIYICLLMKNIYINLLCVEYLYYSFKSITVIG
jgi:hypothetical protein